ncbi:MAG: TlyA family RNA methyltransferase [Desulfobacterales bacterium]|jgi:23S rRNA (cytidine1920-2'-O)/16S rRNA (cytidine1409-2'-O)-methyltransferase|nr:TlyA family RNA methyltransferase [Desulfobacterales bacterium]
MTEKRIRLDRYLVEKGLVSSRERAHDRILAGDVLINRFPVDKPATLVTINSHVELKGSDIPYVSRGGLKLEAALKAFPVSVQDTDCLDIGASTGGFTDCLLQHGARRVYAVDVGYGQLAWKLRQDPRVVVLERQNIRHLPANKIEAHVDVVTIDVSFISLKIVVPAALKFMKEDAFILALIKPQFEVGRGHVGKGGVVRNKAQHDAVIHDLSLFFQKIGLCANHPIPSPILGPKGNREFIIRLTR